jgi:hypothetical protein
MQMADFLVIVKDDLMKDSVLPPTPGGLPFPLPWRAAISGWNVQIVAANNRLVAELPRRRYDKVLNIVAAVNTLGPSSAWSEALSKLDIIIAGQQKLLAKQEKTMADIDDLEAKVTAEEGVEQSAIALLQGLNTELKAALAANDTSRIQALSAKIDSDTQALAAAVAANQPAA